MSRTYQVEVPFAGFVTVFVEVEDDAGKDAAIDLAMKLVDEKVRVESDHHDIKVVEWESWYCLTRGQVSYGPSVRVEAEEVD